VERPCCGDVPDDAIRISATHQWGDRARLAQLPREEARDVLDPTETDVRGWRVWWSDGETVRIYDSRTTRWEDVPESGVQAIVVYFERDWTPGKPYRRLIAHADWYDGWGRRLEGTLVDDDLFDRIMTDAIAAEAW
jgi:hypothetical protein